MSPEERQRPVRPEGRDISELRTLRSAHPELGTAIDMQIALVELHRRMQLRIPTSPSPPSAAEALARLSAGRRLLELAEISLEWSDLRLSIRQTADILARYESLEPADHDAVSALVRNGDGLERVVRAWYEESREGPGRPPSTERSAYPDVLDDLLGIAIRPFLERTVEVAIRTAKLDGWWRPWCPFCGGQPDFAVLPDDHARHLICSRCLARWAWEVIACPWCPTRAASQLPTFTSGDRRYRVYACNVCRRYLKAYDARGARRPVMPVVDTIATLPLDAAAVQQGYST